MKILMVCPECIFPANTGGRIVVYNMAFYLSKMGHEINLFSIVDNDEEVLIQEIGLKPVCKNVYSYNRNHARLKGLFNSIIYPISVGTRMVDQMISDIDKFISKNEIDLIICQFPQMAKSLERIIANVRSVLIQHNIEHLSLYSYAKTISNPIKKAISIFDSHRLKIYEKELYMKHFFDMYVFLSDHDKEIFDGEHPYVHEQEYIMPIGAEVHERENRNRDNNVLIVGKMSYQPNIDGVHWFVKYIWPNVINRVTDAKLYIVGKDPVESIIKLKSDSIIVTGTVDSVEKYYQMSKVAVVPIFVGGGVKTKIIEAASYGIPIVSTRFGTLGTDFDSLEYANITDERKEFARYVIDILNEKKEYTIKSQKAFDLFNKKYTWESIIRGFERNIQNIDTGSMK